MVFVDHQRRHEMGEIALVLLLCVAIATTCLVSTAKCSSQFNVDDFDFMVGYVGSFPKQPIGMRAVIVDPRGWGGVCDLKMARQVSQDDTYDNITVHEAEQVFGDMLIEEYDEWFSISLASGHVVFTRRVFAYVGGGVAFASHYRRYFDEFRILGRSGRYWVRDDSRDRTEWSVSGGLIACPWRSLFVSAGFDTAPKGVTLAVGWRI